MPQDAAKELQRLDALVERAVLGAVDGLQAAQERSGAPQDVMLVRYRTADDLARYRPDMAPYPPCVHGALIDRVRLALDASPASGLAPLTSPLGDSSAARKLLFFDPKKFLHLPIDITRNPCKMLLMGSTIPPRLGNRGRSRKMTDYRNMSSDALQTLRDDTTLSGNDRQAITDEIIRRVREAEDALEIAHEIPPYGDVEWVYYDDAMGKSYVCDSLDDMLYLFDLLHNEDEQISTSAYSHWCAGCSHPEQDDE